MDVESAFWGFCIGSFVGVWLAAVVAAVTLRRR
jgi:hypothetical protein